jgi:hypothetical protein
VLQHTLVECRVLCPVYPFVNARVRRPLILSPLQRAAAGPPSTSGSPLLFPQVAAAARIAGKPDIFDDVQRGDLALVADRLMVDPWLADASNGM